MKNFKSDNYFGVHPKIFEAMIASNGGAAGAYGHDKYTKELNVKLSSVFEHDVSVFLVSTGTVANCLSLQAICPPYGTVYSSKEAHISNDECNAPGFFLNGGKNLAFTYPDKPSKIDLNQVEIDIQVALNNIPLKTKPSCITVTQATELGQVYTLEELQEIGDFAKKYNLKVHMDGARFANALVHLNCTPAEMTWKVGVDVLSFGCTKNGGLMGEAIIFFNEDDAKNFVYIQKRSGQLLSKQRFFSAQILGYLNDDLWIDLAKHANSMAMKLDTKLKAIPKIRSVYSVHSNELFLKMPKNVAESLWKEGFEFYNWDVKEGLYRFVTSWDTSEESIDLFIETAKKLCNSY